MNKIAQSITLDLVGISHNVINARQGDRLTRDLDITITDNGKPYQIQTSAYVYLRGKRADGKSIFYNATVTDFDNGIIHLDIHDYILSSSGRAKLDIGIYNRVQKESPNKEDEIASTESFELYIPPNIFNEDDIVNSDEASTLSQLINSARDEISEMNKAANIANEKATDLQNKLDNNHFVLTKDKDGPNGVPSLDENTKVPIEELYEATTSNAGITQLEDSVTSSSTITAATPNSVKKAYDKAISSETNANLYTDTKIADLINGAPTTLDTLGEIADAMADNQSVVQALDRAIGTKAENAFSNVAVDTTTVAADSKSDTLTLASGNNITITADAANEKITISSTHPAIAKSTDSTSTASPNPGGMFTTVDSVSTDADGHVTKVNTKSVTLPSTPITIDSTLSTTSTNPLQNKVVSSALNNKLSLSGGTVNGNITTTGKIIGGKWCYNATTNYGLYWENETNLIPRSNEYKVNLGTLGNHLNSVAALTFYENGKTLNKIYLSKTGGTIDGALNFANNTWNLVGDDCYLGDNGIAGCVCIKGNNGDTGLSMFAKGSNTNSGSIKYSSAGLFYATKPFSFQNDILFNNGYYNTGYITHTKNSLTICAPSTSTPGANGAGLVFQACASGIFPLDGSNAINNMTLGSPTKRFGTIYSVATSLNSDQKLKKDIELLNNEINIFNSLFDNVEFVKFRWKDNYNGALETLPSRRYHYGIIAQQIEKLMHEYGLSNYDNGFIHSNFFLDNTTGCYITGGYRPAKEGYDYSQNVWNYKHNEEYEVCNEIIETPFTELDINARYKHRPKIQYILIQDISKVSANGKQPPITINSITFVDKEGNYVPIPLTTDGGISCYSPDDINFEHPGSSAAINDDGSVTISFHEMWSSYMLKIADDDNCFNFYDYESIIADIDFIGEYKIYLIPKGDYQTCDFWNDRDRTDEIAYDYTFNYQEFTNMSLAVLQQTRKDYLEYKEKSESKIFELENKISVLENVIYNSTDTN